MKIRGTFTYIEREYHPCPQDGVHVVGKDGNVKGCHSLVYEGPSGKRIVPKGQTGFLWQISETQAAKVFYSFGWFKCLKDKAIKEEIENLKILAKAGISPQYYGMTKAKLDIQYGAKHIKCSAPAMLVAFVDYCPEAWHAYAIGRPYDWTVDEHPGHSPEAYKAFVKRAKKIAKTSGAKIDTSWKLGDCVWSMTKKRWFLVDCGK